MKSLSLKFLFCLFVLLGCGNQPTDNKGAFEEPDSTDLAEVDAEIPISFDYSFQELIGKIDQKNHPDFALVKPPYTDRGNLYLRKAAYEAFKKMYAAAKKDGIKLIIKSGMRNFNYQKGIWERKWKGQRILDSGENAKTAFPNPKDRALKILEYSAMPGTSRHHWGTDIDLNAFNNKYFERGQGLKIYQWLEAKAATFGFCQTYTPKGSERPHGYNEEKWHWSYLPIAKKMTEQAKAQLKNEMITGFLGAETGIEIGVVEKYVLGINKSCF